MNDYVKFKVVFQEKKCCCCRNRKLLADWKPWKVVCQEQMRVVSVCTSFSMYQTTKSLTHRVVHVYNPVKINCQQRKGTEEKRWWEIRSTFWNFSAIPVHHWMLHKKGQSGDGGGRKWPFYFWLETGVRTRGEPTVVYLRMRIEGI